MNLLRYIRPIVYVTLDPDRLSLREVDSSRQVSAPPLVAISRESPGRVLGVGEEARAAAAREPADVFNPFKHPRTLLADFTLAQVLLKAFMNKLFDGRLFAGAPVVVLHPRVNPEGGFTQIEIRALRELAMGAGAAKVIIRHGRELTREELSNLDFSSGGEILR